MDCEHGHQQPPLRWPEIEQATGYPDLDRPEQADLHHAPPAAGAALLRL